MSELDPTKLVVKDESHRFIFVTCPYHESKSGKTLCINRVPNKGKPKGYWYCFHCGAHGELTVNEVDNLAVESVVCEHSPVENRDLTVLQYEYWVREFQEDKSQLLAAKWGVNPLYVLEVGCGWDGQAHTLPMYNEVLEVVGIQRQFPNGFKCAVPGGSLGLFVPTTLYTCEELVITEGCSDLCTALNMGFHGIGRPNALAGKSSVYGWLRLHSNYKQVVIIADNDEPGITGAQALQDHIDSEHSRTQIFVPKEKDLRAEVKAHGAEQVAEHLKGLFDGIQY